MRPPAQVVALSGLRLPPAWRRGNGGSIVLEGPGVVETVIRVQRRARYGIWVAGYFRGRLELRIDGQQVGALSHELNWAGQWTPLAECVLERGSHRLTLGYTTSRFLRSAPNRERPRQVVLPGSFDSLGGRQAR